ncbi:MAG: hypothetical protein WC175_05635 [Candidatus Dojkabacteria bacterium]|jgi:hypothetical protein
MKYLAVIDGNNIGDCKVYGDGKKAQASCLEILKFSNRVGDKEMSISTIAAGTGVPRMTVDFLLKDYEIRRERSTLHRMAQAHGYELKIHEDWNKANKYKRKKNIISVNKV